MSNEKIPNERERIAAIPATCVNNHLRQTARTVSGFYDAVMRQTGLHGNQMMLLIPPYLAESISINRMAEAIGLDRTTLVRNLKLLEEQGFVTVKPGKDLRTRMVSLTPKGHDTLVASLPLWEEAQRQVIELLDSQHNAFMTTLDALNVLERES
jgi:DNA-binding MarR family transcriptional regulator